MVDARNGAGLSRLEDGGGDMKYEPVICEGCGQLVPDPLPDGAEIWHPWVPRSEGQWMASVEGVGVTNMRRCTPMKEPAP